jgi:hypothetical protein
MGCDARKAKSFGKEKPMKRQGKWAPEILSVVAGVVVALVLGAAPGRAAHAAAEPFSQAQVFFEYNSAEGNMGLQLFFDGEWTEVEIRDPKGRPIFETETQGKLRRVGGAEVRFESVEPFFDPTLGTEMGTLRTTWSRRSSRSSRRASIRSGARRLTARS